MKSESGNQILKNRFKEHTIKERESKEKMRRVTFVWDRTLHLTIDLYLMGWVVAFPLLC